MQIRRGKGGNRHKRALHARGWVSVTCVCVSVCLPRLGEDRRALPQKGSEMNGQEIGGVRGRFGSRLCASSDWRLKMQGKS